MMQQRNRWLAVIPIVVGLQLTACGRPPGTSETIEPAHVEHVDGTDFSRVTLTDKAMERVDVQLGTVDQRPVRGQQRKVVAYSAVIYGTYGETWVYTSPEGNSFLRASIEIDYIDGDTAVLLAGPPTGTRVVTVGAGILHGTEFEVGH